MQKMEIHNEKGIMIKVYDVYAHLLFKRPATSYNTGSSKRKGAKFGEGSSMRVDWLSIGCPS